LKLLSEKKRKEKAMNVFFHFFDRKKLPPHEKFSPGLRSKLSMENVLSHSRLPFFSFFFLNIFLFIKYLGFIVFIFFSLVDFHIKNRANSPSNPIVNLPKNKKKLVPLGKLDDVGHNLLIFLMKTKIENMS
jgi:hypothetical protein